MTPVSQQGQLLLCSGLGECSINENPPDRKAQLAPLTSILAVRKQAWCTPLESVTAELGARHLSGNGEG